MTSVGRTALETYARTMSALRDGEWLPAIAGIRRVLADGAGSGTPVFGVSEKYASGHAAGVAHQERTDRMLAYLDALERGLGLLGDLPARVAREYADADEVNASAIGVWLTGE